MSTKVLNLDVFVVMVALTACSTWHGGEHLEEKDHGIEPHLAFFMTEARSAAEI